ncbi:hypothetical protein Nepgr_018078 [Nepenthes gracilis]|uniref:Uncharacterized protein n=1 Tax=Nepenthes gracilis TaxID=150966 RepID=A0AAD3SSC4_NEPGR|nr:hypothetical protein Nepgr_018078 [Nepenthes gracilis]
MDSTKKMTSNGVSSSVNKLVSKGLAVCDKRPILEEVATDVIEVPDLIHGRLDDSVVLTSDHDRKKGQLGVPIAKHSEDAFVPTSFTSLVGNPKVIGLKKALELCQIASNHPNHTRIVEEERQ